MNHFRQPCRISTWRIYYFPPQELLTLVLSFCKFPTFLLKMWVRMNRSGCCVILWITTYVCHYESFSQGQHHVTAPVVTDSHSHALCSNLMMSSVWMDARPPFVTDFCCSILFHVCRQEEGQRDKPQRGQVFQRRSRRREFTATSRHESRD